MSVVYLRPCPVHDRLVAVEAATGKVIGRCDLCAADAANAARSARRSKVKR